MKSKIFCALACITMLLIAFIFFGWHRSQKDSSSVIDQKPLVIYQINFTNRYHLPLVKANLIPMPYHINEKNFGRSLQEILTLYNFRFIDFEPLHAKTLSQKIHHSIAVNVIPRSDYIKGYYYTQVDEKLLKQLQFPHKIIAQVLKILTVEKNPSRLEQYLSGQYAQYLDILKRCCVG